MEKAESLSELAELNCGPEIPQQAQHTAPAVVFSLSRFEAHSYVHQHELAAREFMALLSMLDRNYGGLDQGFSAQPTADLGGIDQDPHIINRICAALSALFSDPNFHLSFSGFRQMLYLQRWIATLFAASTFRNADHILHALNLNQGTSEELTIANADVIKFCLLYTPNSEIPLNLEALWKYDRNLTAALACALLSPRFLGSPAAHAKRETLLKWLPDRLEEIDDLSVLPVEVLHDVYMHCSYADVRERHTIKASINRLVRKKLIELDILDIDCTLPPPVREKPVMLVILEWFTSAHSIFRTHSASLLAARKNFYIVGMGSSAQVDKMGKEIFDEFVEIEGEATLFVRNYAATIRPDIVYYPAFGMFPHSIFLTNLRLAKVQIASYGHPATSKSDYIDYFVLPDDYVGDPQCFSEKLLRLPIAAMPFVPSSATVKKEPVIRQRAEIVRIAIAATTMKINPNFLLTLQTIQRGALRPVEFHFIMGALRGLVYLELRDVIRSIVPDAVLHAHMPYSEYLDCLNSCDMYLNPFPFGNTNGIVDVTMLGLVGVCKTGPEVLEHIDEALFKRLELPDWLIANTVDEYRSAALRLIENDELRCQLRQDLLTRNAVERFYEGEPELFGQELTKLI